MKKIISILIVLVSLSTYSQTEVHNQKVKLKTTPQGSKSDSLIVKGTDNILKYLSRTDFLNGVSGGSGSNYYLNGITKSGNTLTFNVNGTTNQTYVFGSNAYTSYTDHATENYLKSADLTDYATQLWVSNQNYLTSEIDGSITNELQNGSQINLTGYTKPASFTSVLSSDTVNEAIGKLEKGLEDATGGSITETDPTVGSHIKSISIEQKTDWDEASQNEVINMDVTGTTTKTLTIQQNDGGTISASWNDESGVSSVNADWNATSGDALILNKPTIPTNNNQITNGAGYALDNGVVHNTGNEDVYGLKTIKDDLNLDSDLIVNGQSFFNDVAFFNVSTDGISFGDLDNKPQLSISGNTLSLTGSAPVTLPTSSGGSSGTNTSFMQGAGRVLMATDNRWITDSDDVYGFNKEDFTETAGTGAEPIVAWETRGVPIPPNYKIKKIYLSGRTNSTEVTDLEIRVYKRRNSSSYTQGVDSDGEMTNTEIYSGNWFDSGTTYIGDSRDNFDKEITTTDSSNSNVSQATIYFKPVGTITSNRYFYMSYTMELEYSLPQ